MNRWFPENGFREWNASMEPAVLYYDLQLVRSLAIIWLK